MQPAMSMVPARMIPKPDACRGCPFWQDGVGGFVPDEIVPGATVEVLMQNPGEHEERGEQIVRYRGPQVYETQPVPPRPAIGPTGYWLDRRWLPKAGLTRGVDVRVGNVLKCRWRGHNELPPLDGREPDVRQAIRHCLRAHYRRPPEVRVTVALGEYALWATTGHEGIAGWRGWALPLVPAHERVGVAIPRQVWTPAPSEPVVFAAYHPAFVFRAPWEAPTLAADWGKLGRLIRGEWPTPMPPIQTVAPASAPGVAGFDTEFIPSNRRLLRWSLAYVTDTRLQVHVVDGEALQPRWAEAPEPPCIYAHNWVADMPYWERLYGGETQHEDSMYQHAVLNPESEHTMDYLGSLYARINRWKHLEHLNLLAYSAGDAIGALDVGLALTSRLAADRASERVYREFMLPLLPTLSAYERGRGLKLAPKRVTASLEALNRVRHETQRHAQASAGWPINLASSKQVGAQLFGVERV